jgi:hypothetical protein
MGKTNREWHAHNRMPERATPAQRVAWHTAHARNCACRPIPAGVLALMRAATGRTGDAAGSRGRRDQRK